MAKIKNEVDKKPKTKSLFDHINEVRVGKNPKYFETLSDADKKTWSNYMVCRFLSMQMDFVDSINDLHKHHVVPRSLGGKKTIKICSVCHGKIHNLDFTNHGNFDYFKI